MCVVYTFIGLFTNNSFMCVALLIVMCDTTQSFCQHLGTAGWERDYSMVEEAKEEDDNEMRRVGEIWRTGPGEWEEGKGNCKKEEEEEE